MKNTLITLGRTLNGKPRAAERLTALGVRRSRVSLRRFMESLDGEGFSFQSSKVYTSSRS